MFTVSSHLQKQTSFIVSQKTSKLEVYMASVAKRTNAI